MSVVTRTAQPGRLDGARRRHARQAALASGSVGFAVAALGSSVVLAARDIAVDEAQLGWLASAFGVGLLAVGAFGRRLLRHGGQRALRRGAVVLAAGAVLLAVAPDVVTAVAGGFLLGLGAAVLLLVIPILLAGPDATARYSRAAAVASAAGVLAPAALGALDLTGVTGRTALLVLVVPLAVLARSTRQDVPAVDPMVPTACESSPARLADPGALARRWAAMVLAVAVEFCFVVWGVGRLEETGISTGAAAALASTFPIGMAAGRAVVPRLTSRDLSPIAISTGAAATGTVVLVAADSAALTAAGMAIAGLGVAAMYPLTLAQLMAVPGVETARAAALATLASGTAIVIAPAVLGLLGQGAGLRASFLVTLPLLAALVVVAKPPTGS